MKYCNTCTDYKGMQSACFYAFLSSTASFRFELSAYEKYKNSCGTHIQLYIVTRLIEK